MNVIRFTKVRFVMVILSLILIAGGVATTVFLGGFNLGVDFQAGLSVRFEVDAADATTESVRAALSAIDGVQVQTVGPEADRQFTIGVRDNGEIFSFMAVVSGQIVDGLQERFGAESVTELESNFVGPRFSEELTRNTILLTALAMALILVYIWFRFKLGYATASIMALLHDVAFMLAFIGAFQIEVSAATIAAILTIIGYSLNDTIVIFDRIRENETLMRDSSFEGIINTSITQSLSRTLITSLTTLLAVSAIYIIATGQVQAFALNLIVGVVVGTYSSVFVASPVLLGWRRAARRRSARKDAGRRGVAITEKKLEEAKEAAPAAEKSISTAEKDRMLEELRQKRAGVGGKNTRAQRKKKR